MKIAFASMALGLAVIAVPTLGQNQNRAKDPDQPICKIEKKVNSRFTRKVCHTRAEWEAISEANKRDYVEQRDRPSIVPPGT
jgi:hypothetical protein